ncbi:RNA-binding domain-containing protein [Hesseltinella vesiculosa]|uniref:RNA-binding domain-containing protein n=1 Tax=Hesseltinella vesiculosa TaxID=101127 RepID=A0A1X2GAW6_9FUNG|nr:RNA-binding domain-containing protein [Hesseltinella vesiculosa]
MPPSTLHVAGFSSHIRARDLAYEFERFGPLVRCDIPAPKNPKSVPFAFVEFEDPRDAVDAFNDMHGFEIDGCRISVQWAKSAPSPSWRLGRSDRSPPRRYRSPSPGFRRPAAHGRSRSRSPYGGRHHRGPPLPPPPPHHHHHHHPPPHYHHGPPSPRRGRSPPHHLYDRGRSRSRSPPPPPPPQHHQHRPGPPDDYPPPPSDRPLSNPRRSSRSVSPPRPNYDHFSSGSPVQDRSVSPRRSMSPTP